MKIALVTDEFHPINVFVLNFLKKRGFNPMLFGSYISHKDTSWVHATAEAAQAVSNGTCEEGIFFCWSGTGACIVANKTRYVRAALCTDAETARLSRIWNHANVLVLSNRSLIPEIASQILDAWFSSYDLQEGYVGVNDLAQWEKVTAFP